MREPESQEAFETEFQTEGMTTKECMDFAEQLFITLRKEAAERAAIWLVNHGYFNGELENVMHVTKDGTCVVKVIVTCYGLPMRIMEAECHNENERLRGLIRDVIDGNWCITELQEAIGDV